MSGGGNPFRIRRGAYSPEAAQFANVARGVARGEIPLSDVIAALDNRNVPPQLKQIPFMTSIASASDSARILIPENRNRMSFLVSFIDLSLASPSMVLLTYGAPPAPNFGIPLLSPNDPYGESNGTISIDAIWIAPFNNMNNNATYPAVVIGYEGSLAIESHLHRQTTGG